MSWMQALMNISLPTLFWGLGWVADVSRGAARTRRDFYDLADRAEEFASLPDAATAARRALDAAFGPRMYSGRLALAAAAPALIFPLFPILTDAPRDGLTDSFNLYTGFLYATIAAPLAQVSLWWTRLLVSPRWGRRDSIGLASVAASLLGVLFVAPLPWFVLAKVVNAMTWGTIMPSYGEALSSVRGFLMAVFATWLLALVAPLASAGVLQPPYPQMIGAMWVVLLGGGVVAAPTISLVALRLSWPTHGPALRFLGQAMRRLAGERMPLASLGLVAGTALWLLLWLLAHSGSVANPVLLLVLKAAARMMPTP